MKSLLISSHELSYYKSLNERQRRLYVALKAIELGWNGVAMVCKAYEINRKTIYKGKKELLASENEITTYKCRQKKRAVSIYTLVSHI
jgi:hypothetical protein